ncbi:MAG: heavy metal translocating P-type ATPase [Nitrospirae bacterium]|nr:MAG: heavy metal translocating P-type ATPase [Nitrospirota bacterium]
MSNNAVCHHCLSEIREGSEIREVIDGVEYRFCCHGCQGVYHILHESGLEDFYKKRTDWRPGPPPELITEPDTFRKFIREEDGFLSLEVHLGGIRCASCIWLIERYLKGLDGIEDVRVNFATHRAVVRWDPEKIGLEQVINAFQSIGYPPAPALRSDLQKSLGREKRDLLIRFGTSAFFSMQLMLYTVALYAGYFQGIEETYRRVFQFIAWGLATPVVFYGGAPFLRSTVRGLKNRSINMDFLIFTGSFSAYAYSVAMIFTGGEVFFDTSAMIITLILLGRFLESSARERAGEALSRLITLQPDEARVVEGGERRMLPVSAIKEGTLVEVLPGERIPLDGEVVEGGSDVDEAVLTGESVPVGKSIGDEVFAGTMNIDGRLLFRVTRKEGETALSGIIKTVEEAQFRKAPIQRLADRVVGWFVPAVFLISASAFIYWYFNNGKLSVAVMNSVAVLVVACPCALGLATPLAILIGSSNASTRGILIKGGDVLETLVRADLILFDKTGTLTKGMPVVEGVYPEVSKEEILRYAASLERNSEHPIGSAVTEAYRGELFEVTEFSAVPGRGVKGRVEERVIMAGNLRFMKESSLTPSTEIMERYREVTERGKTVFFVAVEGEVIGMIILSDSLKEDARSTVNEIKRAGLRPVIVTGDNERVAREMASVLQVDDYYSEVSPVEKAGIVRDFRKSGSRGVIMIGDGINDTPALIEADVGITMGSATDIAMESADVVVIRDKLSLIPELLALSRRTFRVIKENLFWAFSYNIVAIPLAVTGLLHPIVSALSMAVSSLVVVGNSLRLRR